MPGRKPSNKRTADPGPAGSVRQHLANLFAKSNRGLLLDIFVFVLNVSLMRLLTRLVMDLLSEVSIDEPIAQLALGFTFFAMWILPPAGAVLKRWHFHQRRKARDMTLESEETKLSGCLFNPIFYFCLNLVITSAGIASLGEFVFGRRLDSGAIFVPMIFAGLILTIVQTFLIYRYFSPPKKPPSKFLRSPQSEMLGDVCIFLNMILFQVFWNMLTFHGLGHPSGPVEFIGRLFILIFLALLIYFPPRIFYLAEDINRPRTWVTMLLANSPVIFRVLIGTGSSSTTGW